MDMLVWSVKKRTDKHVLILMNGKRLLLLALYLTVGLSGYAQQTHGADSLARYAIGKPVVEYDTVQAVRQLFAAKRDVAGYTANIGMLTTGVGGVFLLSTLAFANLVGGLVGLKPDPGRVAVLGLKLTSPGLLITSLGVAKRIRYNRKREEAILLAYEQGQPLPPFVRRSLTRRYDRLNR
ncbi:hypothetical protein CLV58_101229 [Spirosoma oryzae]|uniref:Uncharacterized protein n=2 Tax=Spirosoma oryzae TaxID=1469603 RepID=A0A2T0TND5_9BACT|nr:hypothetical protein CLV58_101229 [Spirosoma oryzae]